MSYVMHHKQAQAHRCRIRETCLNPETSRLEEVPWNKHLFQDNHLDAITKEI